MPFSAEFLLSYIEAETAVRRQLLLRGYELGSGGERLGPEEAVAFLEGHFPSIYLDVIAATREERHDLKRASEQMIRETTAWYASLEETFTKRLDESSKPIKAALETIESFMNFRARWQTTRAGILAQSLHDYPMLLAVRVGQRRGVAFVQQRSRTFWERLSRRHYPAALIVMARWEDGTSSILPDQESVDWYPMMLPN